MQAIREKRSGCDTPASHHFVVHLQRCLLYVHAICVSVILLTRDSWKVVDVYILLDCALLCRQDGKHGPAVTRPPPTTL